MKFPKVNKHTVYRNLARDIRAEAINFLDTNLAYDETQGYSKELDAHNLCDDAYSYGEQIAKIVFDYGDVANILNTAYVSNDERKKWMDDETKYCGPFILDSENQRDIIEKLITGVIECAFFKAAIDRGYVIHHIDEVTLLTVGY